MKPLTTTVHSSFLSSTDKWAMVLIPICLFLALARCTDKFDAHRELCAINIGEKTTNINCWWIPPSPSVSTAVKELYAQYGVKAEHIIVSKKQCTQEEALLFWEIVILENEVLYCNIVDEVYIYDLLPLQR